MHTCQPDSGLYKCACGQHWSNGKAVARMVYEQEYLRRKEETIGPIDYTQIPPVLEGIEKRYVTGSGAFHIDHSEYVPWGILASANPWHHDAVKEWAPKMSYQYCGRWTDLSSVLMGPWDMDYPTFKSQSAAYIKIFQQAQTVGIAWFNPVTDSPLVVEVPWDEFMPEYSRYHGRYYTNTQNVTELLIHPTQFVSARNDGFKQA